MAPRKPTLPTTSLWQRIALNVIMLAVGAAAFRMSFDHHVDIAQAAGIPFELAIFYPLVVDAAILAAMLIGIWIPTLTSHQRRYVWITVAFFTALSIANNSLSVLVLDPDSVTMPMAAAIAVHAVPAITLFVIVHLAVTTVLNPAYRPPRTTNVTAPAPAPAATRPVRAPRSTRTPDPTVVAQVHELAAQNLSVREIASRVGRGKTWVAEQLRDTRQGAAA